MTMKNETNGDQPSLRGGGGVERRSNFSINEEPLLNIESEPSGFIFLPRLHEIQCRNEASREP